jgi:hypothetical protein
MYQAQQHQTESGIIWSAYNNTFVRVNNQWNPFYATTSIARTRALHSGAVLGIAIVLSGCSPSVPQLHSGIAARAQCPALHQDDYFFPNGALIPGDEADDETQRAVLSNYLSALSAESLSCGNGRDGYRLIRIRGGARQPIVVSVSKDTITVVEFFAPNEKPFAVRERRAFAVAETFFANVSTELHKSTFWTANAFSDLEGDGAIWLLEVREGKRYKAVTRVVLDDALTLPVNALLAAANIPTM